MTEDKNQPSMRDFVKTLETLEPDPPPVSTHLIEARHMAEQGDIEGAIRHIFWHAYHVGVEDGTMGRDYTHSNVYDALSFLLELFGRPPQTMHKKESRHGHQE